MNKTTAPIPLTTLCILLFITHNLAAACTGFTATENNTVLVGNNEDWNAYDFWIRFIPATHNTHGRVIFENPWPITPNPNWRCPQAGMNDQGLFYDCFATPPLLPINSTGKPHYYNSSDHYQYSLESYCLSVCTTIQEVLTLYNHYNLQHMERYQVLWVDHTGASVIIEGDDIVPKQGTYQVVTNFIQTHPELGGYPCWRYNTAVTMLNTMNNLTVDYFTTICNATHQTGTYPSIYSTVYDLNQQLLYLYYFYQYDTVVTIDLAAELAQGAHTYFLADLFPTSNHPPQKPQTPTGPHNGIIGETYTYQTQTIDPNNDQIQYLFNWGDGTNSGWLGPYPSGTICETTHTWERRGTYDIRVRAKDPQGLESEWSDPLPVNMPKTLFLENTFLLNLLKQLPTLFPLLQYILRITGF